MFLVLSALCAGVFSAVCSEAEAPAVPVERPAQFLPVERDTDLTTKLQEMLDGTAALCRRNQPASCLGVQTLTALRVDLYATSQTCALPEPRDCDLFAVHRENVLTTYETFKSTALDRERFLGQPTEFELRIQAQQEEQKRRDEAFKRRIDAMETGQSGFLTMLTQ